MFRLKLVPDNSAFDFLRQMRLTAAFSAMLVLVLIISDGNDIKLPIGNNLDVLTAEPTYS